jgi:hypothetical protein
MAMALLHVNYAYISSDHSYLDRVLPKMMHAITFETISHRFSKMIQSNRSPETLFKFRVNRRAALLAASENAFAGEDSIVAQVATIFDGLYGDISKLRVTPIPWSVQFIGEPAIDAGGPARELLNEFAASIFDPSSQLVIPVGNEFFIPYPNTTWANPMRLYRAIGTFIGIVLRTGLCQALPFAPFVWRFLAKEDIREIDLTSLDTELRDRLKSLRETIGDHSIADRIDQEWKITDWLGNIVPIGEHSVNSRVKEWEIEQFIGDCVQFRIVAVRPYLAEMRDALYANIGLRESPYLTGEFLSRACQGDSVISVDEMRRYATYSGCNMDDGSVQLLWAVIEKMTNDQRSLFLRFVTTMTRLPIRATDGFRIDIQRVDSQNPDKEFIHSSTCFNRLYLPTYTSFPVAWEMITTAIASAPTMENH